MELQKNLKLLRKYHNVSLGELARWLGLPRRYLWELENKKRQPDIETVARLSRVFAITMEQLCFKEMKIQKTESNE